MPIAPHKPVVLLASSRSNGNTFSVARAALPEASAPLIDLSLLNIGYYSYSHANRTDDFLPLVERLLVSPVWVVATPLYWYSMSAQAKTFLDRLSDLLSFQKSLGHQLKGKGLAVVCSGTDPELPMSFTQTFELTASYLGMHFQGTHYAQFSGAQFLSPQAPPAAAAFGSALSEAANIWGKPR